MDLIGLKWEAGEAGWIDQVDFYCEKVTVVGQDTIAFITASSRTRNVPRDRKRTAFFPSTKRAAFRPETIRQSNIF